MSGAGERSGLEKEQEGGRAQSVAQSLAQSLGRRLGGRVLVVGMAGGIGSGKSRVASEFAGLGCVVTDSDRVARALFERADVVLKLRSWWGERIFDDEGRLDRKKVAGIVFEDDRERERLEGLVHPMIHDERRATVDRVRRGGGGVVVVDAPLLFEAGVSEECDAVVFVDCPVEERERRVREGRGWAAGELARREKVQMPLDVKASRSDYVVVNDGSDGLGERVETVLESILSSTQAD